MANYGTMGRRGFLKGAVAGLAAGSVLSQYPARALQAARRVPPGEKIRIAVIGNGGMGSRHIEALATNPNCELVALCDAAKGRYIPQQDKVESMVSRRPDGYQDFREVLERPDIDAVWVVTPDNWHPLISILACQAGKDVYVEKPVAMTVAEGRAMVEAARRYGRIMQVGTQQRSMPVFQKAINVVHSGRIGTVTHATAWVSVNEFGVGDAPSEVPRGLDWDMWLGPAPEVPFSMDRFGGWMGWHDYARGGQLTNWGVHLMDIVQWGIRQDRPLSVQALGGSYRNNAAQDNYETIEAILEYPGCSVTWEQRRQNIHENKGYGIAFYGTDGAVFVDRGSFVVTPKSLGIPEWIGEPEKSWAYPPHHDNFFDCIRSRQKPAADIEQAFRTTTSVLLAGISLKVGRKLFWDSDRETFINDEQANRHLARSYRAPWHL
jgi:predicted dehydrogenase